MAPSHVATALCMLATLVVVPASVLSADLATAASPMLFAEWFHSQKAGPSTRAKLLGEREKPETKHICLQETRQYNCRYVGCPNIEFSGDAVACRVNSTECLKCKHGTVFQSDLTCCGDEDNSYSYGSYGEEHDGFGSGVRSPILKIGTCDWDVNLHSVDPADGARQNSIIENGEKLGDAWATCYLSAGSEYCHDLLCDKAVLTFQGGVYVAVVKSTLPSSLNTAYPDLSCLNQDSFSTIFAGARRASRNATTPVLYEGTAIVMSGFVKITSLDRKTEYTNGYMDYCPLFTPASTGGNNNNGALSNNNLAVVTPNTYNIKLVGKKPANKAYSYTGSKVSQ